MAAVAALASRATASGQTMTPRPAVDDSDRSAFRAWFTLLADAEFVRRSDDVVDCASLVRHAYREALRTHSPAWYQQAKLPRLVAFPDVRHAPPARDGAWPLFKVAAHPDRYAEFADADAIVQLNTRRIGRDVRAAEPGDLLYFRHDEADSPSHVMVFVGTSEFDRDRHDWLVYHTGPDAHGPGEVRKVSVADLERHPSPRWRPTVTNASFIGVYRLAILDREH
jgi:hypothetical protein